MLKPLSKSTLDKARRFCEESPGQDRVVIQTQEPVKQPKAAKSTERFRDMKCAHPGCKKKLEPCDFGEIGGTKFVMPASAYCDDHVKLYIYGSDKKMDDKMTRHADKWGKYANYNSDMVPPRKIIYCEAGQKGGIEVSIEDMMVVIAESKKGCLFQGDTGLGKTYALARLSTHLLRETGRMPIVRYAPALRIELTEAATSNDAREKSRVIEMLSSADRLFIDDIGSASFTDSYEEAVKIIIENRGKNNLPTFTSIQHTSAEFYDLGSKATRHRREAILRRLCDDCLIFKFTAE